MWDREYDVVLVGAGVGSLVAAIRAAEHGLTSLLIEKTQWVGGACAYSGGIVWAPNNHRMRAKGLPDSADDAMAYLESLGGARWNPVVARAYVEAVPDVVEWLEEHTLLRWVSYPDFPDYFAEGPGGKFTGRCLLPHPKQAGPVLDTALAHHSELGRVRKAIHFPGREEMWAGGRALVGCLWLKLLENDAETRFGSRATSLVMNGSSVAGVTIQEPGGQLHIRARHGVLLNTGGFEWNVEATRRWVPGGRLLHPQTPPSNEGDGQRMAVEAGAAMDLMDETIRVPAVRIHGAQNEGSELYRLLFRELALPHSIVVNRQGRRFANETFFQDLAGRWQADPGNLPSFLVFDRRYRDQYGLPGGLRVGRGVTEHHVLSDLADTHGVDTDGLTDSVDRYNAAVGAGRDHVFARGETAYHRVFGDPTISPNPTLGTLEQPPFYAVELHPATSGHRGGAVIDARGHVLGVDGRPIEGLAACGNAAAGQVTGRTYITGSSIGHAITFAALAADNSAAQARGERLV